MGGGRHIVLPTLLAALCAGVAAAEPVEVPSGQTVRFVEVIKTAPGTAGTAYRFRFLAPDISVSGDSIAFEDVVLDMEFLCVHFALPRLDTLGPAPAQIVVSLSDRPVAFGQPAPEATQFFEAYRIEDGACIWEEY